MARKISGLRLTDDVRDAMIARRMVGATYSAIAAEFGFSQIYVQQCFGGWRQSGYYPPLPTPPQRAEPEVPAAAADDTPTPAPVAIPRHIAAIIADPRHRVRGKPPTPREAAALWEQMRVRHARAGDAA